jgi:hypothetical protein
MKEQTCQITRNTYCIICLKEKHLHQTRAGIGPITNMPCPTAASDPKAFDMAIGHMQAIRMLSVFPSEYGLEYGYLSLDN